MEIRSRLIVKVNDENLNPVSDGDMKRAYMPWGVWKLAHLRTEIKGLRSSQNADSYAQLVNGRCSLTSLPSNLRDLFHL